MNLYGAHNPTVLRCYNQVPSSIFMNEHPPWEAQTLAKLSSHPYPLGRAMIPSLGIMLSPSGRHLNNLGATT
jgi:hypothetical protein